MKITDDQIIYLKNNLVNVGKLYLIFGTRFMNVVLKNSLVFKILKKKYELKNQKTFKDYLK